MYVLHSFFSEIKYGLRKYRNLTEISFILFYIYLGLGKKPSYKNLYETCYFYKGNKDKTWKSSVKKTNLVTSEKYKLHMYLLLMFSLD